MADMNVPLPFEIQEEILKRVPEVKSLLQFRSVSKSWKSLIDSPRFIAAYHQSQPPRRHIFVWYLRIFSLRNSFVSIIDNDDDDSHSFAQHKLPLTIPNPVTSHGSGGLKVYGSSQGLFCLYWNYIAFLWNPSIRKSVPIDVPNASYEYVIGFGVSPYSNDPKLVRIQIVVDVSDDLKSRRVEIYSLSTGEWRTLSEDLPCSSVEFYDYDQHVAIGNFIFWLGHEMKGMDMKREMIILFDMISDKFMEICLPDNVVTKDQHSELSLFKLRESLAVVESYFNHSVDRRVNHVWMMQGGVSDFFTKMFTIIRPDAAHFSILAFRNNGHPIIQMNNVNFKGSDELVVYEPDSDQFTPIGASESRYTIYGGSYMETLLLLDH